MPAKARIAFATAARRALWALIASMRKASTSTPCPPLPGLTVRTTGVWSMVDFASIPRFPREIRSPPRERHTRAMRARSPIYRHPCSRRLMQPSPCATATRAGTCLPGGIAPSRRDRRPRSRSTSTAGSEAIAPTTSAWTPSTSTFSTISPGVRDRILSGGLATASIRMA